jgi:hypothetical protein
MSRSCRWRLWILLSIVGVALQCAALLWEGWPRPQMLFRVIVLGAGVWVMVWSQFRAAGVRRPAAGGPRAGA